MRDMRHLDGLPEERLVLYHGGPHLATDVDLETGAEGGVLCGHVGEADTHAQTRRQRPAGDLAAALHRVAGTRDAATVDRERHELLGRAGSAHRAYGVRADEVRVLAAAPA